VTLRFGIFDHMERRPDVPLDRLYAERLDLLEELDRSGFHAYHLAEHHQSPLCMAPSQGVFLAAAAQRTSRLLLGSLVYLLPMYHPVRLVEEVCMLDNLCGGRLQIGVGRGISALEHSFWGHEPAESQARFDEALAVLVEGLRHDTLTYSGRFYRFDALPMELRPKQQPHPPFWYAGNAEFAARHGMHFIGSGTIKRLPETVARYRTLWAATRDGGQHMNAADAEPLVGSTRHLFVADSDEEAVACARRAWQSYHQHFPKRGHENSLQTTRPAGAPVAPNAGGPSLGGDFDLALKVEAVVAGSPATVREYVRRYAEESTSNYFVASFQWGDITHAEAMHSVRLFAEQVMPAVARAGV
jgi:alkanesulfonate monooxygenase SsuD/methylene tetrahydromethanopterin reductase-like flavin-dependent oxidoreductase (luciferase family)